ncbi:MAG: type I pantothenate kinase [Myxococcales bacterium]|nr:type I pantothenate kinase [Myxococcales bacterium]MCB9669577.1 type I pantothenate kinase [Alphaproteobacteria bacterium]MCB9695054.1 type I pantothenate kinase [Alphaproteobacteria bacterium]
MDPFVRIPREDWAPLATWQTRPLSEAEVARLQGVVDKLDIPEIEAVYLPLARLLRLRIDAARKLARETAEFLGHERHRVPFVIGLAGSVAVGKSTAARVLGCLLERGRPALTVARVTTDGFLYPNAELERRGILRRKGFPESYDQRGLLGFVAALKSGEPRVTAPVYSHQHYDVVPGEELVLEQPDVAIIEGLNVLQSGTTGVFVSDFFDFSLYVDADIADLRAWYVARFERLRRTAFQDPDDHFHRFAHLTDDEARAVALSYWTEINEVNLRENILGTRERADLILEKGPDHTIREVRLRKA